MTTKRKNIIAMIATPIVVWMGVEIALLPFWLFGLSAVLCGVALIWDLWKSRR